MEENSLMRPGPGKILMSISLIIVLFLSISVISPISMFDDNRPHSISGPGGPDEKVGITTSTEEKGPLPTRNSDPYRHPLIGLLANISGASTNSQIRNCGHNTLIEYEGKLFFIYSWFNGSDITVSVISSADEGNSWTSRLDIWASSFHTDSLWHELLVWKGDIHAFIHGHHYEHHYRAIYMKKADVENWQDLRTASLVTIRDMQGENWKLSYDEEYIYMAVTQSSQWRSLFYRYDGTSWTPGFQISFDGETYFSSIAAFDTGPGTRLVYTYCRLYTPGYSTGFVYARTSDDLGETWSDPVVVMNDHNNYYEHDIIQLGDSVHIISGLIDESDIRITTSTDGGSTWSTERTILKDRTASSYTNNGYSFSIGSRDGGRTLSIVYEGGNDEVRMIYSKDRGATWIDEGESILLRKGEAYDPVISRDSGYLSLMIYGGSDSFIEILDIGDMVLDRFAPTNLTLDRSVLRMNLSWDPPRMEFFSDFNFEKYVIFWGASPDNIQPYRSIGNVTSFTDVIEITAQAVYYYAVGIVFTELGLSTLSNIVSGEVILPPPRILAIEGPRLISNISYGHFTLEIDNYDRSQDILNVTVLTRHVNDEEWADDMVSYLRVNTESGMWEFDIVPSSETPLGNHSVEVVVIDDMERQVERTFSDLFVIYNVNDPPFILGTPKKNCLEDTLYEFGPLISDGDPEDIHTWTMDTDAMFLSIDVQTGHIRGTPDNSHLGNYNIGLTVTDRGGLFDMLNFTLTVINVNDPPEIISEFPGTLTEDVPFTLKLEAIDIDPTGDLLLWSMRTNCSFLNLKRAEGILSGTPANKDVGPFHVLINVSDGNGGFHELNFTSEVINVNDPPGLKNPPGFLEFNEDETFRIGGIGEWFRDEDGDRLDIQHSTPGHLYITLTEGTELVIEPLPDWCGEETVKFTASDGEYYVEFHVIIKIRPMNDSPLNISIAMEGDRFEVNERIVVSGNANDADMPYGDELTFRWFRRGGSPLGKGQMIEFYLDEGVHEIILNVTDSNSAGGETSVVITIYRERSFLDTYGALVWIIAAVLLMIAVLVIFLLIWRRMSKEQTEKVGVEPGDDLPATGAADGFSSSLIGGTYRTNPELPTFMKQPEELPLSGAASTETGPVDQLPPASVTTEVLEPSSEYVRPERDHGRHGFQAPPSPGDMVSRPPAVDPIPAVERLSGDALPTEPTVTAVIEDMFTDGTPSQPAEDVTGGTPYSLADTGPEFNSPVWTPEMVERRMTNDARSAVELLRELNDLRAEGAITEEEYQVHKKRLLRKL